MSQETPIDLETLAGDIRDVIALANALPRTAANALARTLGELLLQTSASEDQLVQFLDAMRDACVREWRQRKGAQNN